MVKICEILINHDKLNFERLKSNVVTEVYDIYDLFSDLTDDYILTFSEVGDWVHEDDRINSILEILPEYKEYIDANFKDTDEVRQLIDFLINFVAS